MLWNAFITCAVTGAGDTTARSNLVPVTPEQIADAAVEAAKAGAAIVHCHVREPSTGQGSRKVEYYEEVVKRIRAADVDVLINLTAGMGGDVVTDPDLPRNTLAPESDLVGPVERLAHVEHLCKTDGLRPDICTMDCGNMTFGEGNMSYISTPAYLRTGIERVNALGVKPELEVFDTGHLSFVNRMAADGLIGAPPFIQLCTGIPYGAPDDPLTMAALVHNLPADAVYSSFALGRMQMPWAVQALLYGANIRVGLEDNLYLEKGVLATNGQLVEKAVKITDLLGVKIMNAEETRSRLGLKKAA
ncbi:MAG: beta-keto acid cleavage family enzyme [Rhodospirillales bacterium]